MRKLLIALVVIGVYVRADDLTGRDIVEKVVTSEKAATTKMHIKLIQTDIKRGKEKVKVRELIRYQKHFTSGNYKSKSLFRFIKPDIIRGTGFLIWENNFGDNDQWLFLPKLQSARRIEAQEKTKSFMNTEFSYEDLESIYKPDDQYFLDSEENYGDRHCYIVEVISHTNTQYKRRLAWIDSEDWLLRKVEFYDKDNKLLKVLTIEDYHKSNGFSFSEKMIMKNNQTRSKSVMEISDIQYNIDLPDQYFTKESLANPE